MEEEFANNISMFVEGKQKLALESIKHPCWKCNNEVESFTQVLFPAIPIYLWKTLYRKYYAHITIDDLTEIESAKSIIHDINQKFKNESENICSVQKRPSKMRPKPYLANICPFCNVIQGAFPLSENRVSAIRSELERKIESIFIRKVIVNVDRKLIEFASYQIECSDYYLPQNYLKHVKNPIKKIWMKFKENKNVQ